MNEVELYSNNQITIRFHLEFHFLHLEQYNHLNQFLVEFQNNFFSSFNSFLVPYNHYKVFQSLNLDLYKLDMVQQLQMKQIPYYEFVLLVLDHYMRYTCFFTVPGLQPEPLTKCHIEFVFVNQFPSFFH